MPALDCGHAHELGMIKTSTTEITQWLTSFTDKLEKVSLLLKLSHFIDTVSQPAYKHQRPAALLHVERQQLQLPAVFQHPTYCTTVKTWVATWGAGSSHYNSYEY
jgi:hypothetical protein